MCFHLEIKVSVSAPLNCYPVFDRTAVPAADICVWRLWPGEHDNCIFTGPAGCPGGAEHLPFLHWLVQGWTPPCCTSNKRLNEVLDKIKPPPDNWCLISLIITCVRLMSKWINSWNLSWLSCFSWLFHVSDVFQWKQCLTCQQQEISGVSAEISLRPGSLWTPTVPQGDNLQSEIFLTSTEKAFLPETSSKTK